MPTAAVLGASSNREKWGNKAVRAFVDRGYQVYPVNPSETEIEGLSVFSSITDVPGTLDIVTVYLAPSRAMALLEAIAKKGCRELWLNPGAGNPEVVAKAKALGLNVISACSLLGIGANPGAY